MRQDILGVPGVEQVVTTRFWAFPKERMGGGGPVNGSPTSANTQL